MADLKIQSGIAYVSLKNPPVNSLSTAVLLGLGDALEAINKESDLKAVVVCGAGRAFCAGAAIDEFSNKKKSARKPPSLHEVTAAFESLDVPVIAAIHGFALGGGLELALSCHYRVCSKKAAIGLPEVNIGLLPGAKGTQVMPRLVGVENALKIITSGDHIPAGKAKEMGLVDLVVDAMDTQGMCKAAADFALNSVSAANLSERRLSQRKVAMPPQLDEMLTKWRGLMAKKRPGQPAPQAIINCIEAATKLDTFAEGLAVEAKEFQKLLKSPEAAALQHVFFAERGAKKTDIPRDVKPRAIKTVGIVGAGLMGGGIAMCCANVGIAVALLDIDDTRVEKGMNLIKKNYARSRRMSDSAKARALGLIRGTTDYSAFAQCDLVVEAVFESMDIKKKVFTKLDEVCKADAFLCSNTSALDLDEIARTCRPFRRPFIMGTHFFSPANVMKLLENVRAAETSDLTVASMMKWGTRIGKWTILAGNCNGFVGNRMIGFYSGAARAQLQQGVLPSQVDKVATAFGMRMGPFAMSDLVGLDLGIQAKKKAGTYDPATKPDDALVEMGRKGQKTKAGWYDYDDMRRPSPSAVVQQILRNMFPAKGSRTADDITKALFIPLINEGFKILEEGMAQRPADIDVCYVHGYNFPRTKGGPMFYADAIGLPVVRDTLLQMDIPPAQLLLTCIEKGMSLGKFWRKHGKEVRAAGLAKLAGGKPHYSRVKRRRSKL